METIGTRIKTRRKELRITQKELGRRLKVSDVTVSQWEADRNAPRGENLYNIARLFGVSANWILTGKTSHSPQDTNLEPAPFPQRTKPLPVISHVQAGNWTEAIDYFESGNDIQWEDAPITSSEQSFWLRVVGDSMTAPIGVSIPEGHLILVDPDIPPENGKLVVAKLDGTDEVTFKKLVIDAGQKYLKPLNPSYDQIKINGNCRIVGVVIEAKVKL